MRRKLVIILSLIILTIVSFAWILSRSSAPLKVTAAFIGYTNNPAGTKVAMVAVTNHGDIRIFRWDAYHLGTEARKGLFPVYYGSSAVLEPGQSEVVVLPAPTNRWRVGIDISCDDWRRKVSFFAAGLPPQINNLVPKSAQKVPTELALTDWIDP